MNRRVVLFACCLLALVSVDAFAAGGGNSSGGEAEFGGYWDMLQGWVTGRLGMVITLLSLLVSLLAALTGSLRTLLITVGIALTAVLGPPTIESIFSAGIPVATTVAQVAAPLVG